MLLDTREKGTILAVYKDERERGGGTSVTIPRRRHYVVKVVVCGGIVVE